MCGLTPDHGTVIYLWGLKCMAVVQVRFELTNWLTDWLTHSLTHFLTHWPICWLSNWITNRLTGWHSDSIPLWLNDSSTDTPTNWTDSMTDWLTDSFTNSLSYQLIDWSSLCQIIRRFPIRSSVLSPNMAAAVQRLHFAATSTPGDEETVE